MTLIAILVLKLKLFSAALMKWIFHAGEIADYSVPPRLLHIKSNVAPFYHAMLLLSYGIHFTLLYYARPCFCCYMFDSKQLSN